MALCWVMHIVGDMHEPLHAALWMDTRYPITDRGGNGAWVRTRRDAAPERLHWFWDSAGAQAGREMRDPEAFAGELARLHPDADAPPPSRPRAAFDAWVRRSRELARAVVYRRGALATSPRAEDAPVLPPDYVAEARTTAERRLAEAGWRIGALLEGVR